MTRGPSEVVQIVRGVTSLDEVVRRADADVCSWWLTSLVPLDDDEARVLVPVHIWAMCIEPTIPVRDDLLMSIHHFAICGVLPRAMAAEIVAWLRLTSWTADEAETVELLSSLATQGPEVPLTPERAGPLVDVLRGVTSADPDERARAVGYVPELLAELRPAEQRGLTGVLARAAIVEPESHVRATQLDVLAGCHERGAVHAHDARLVLAALPAALSPRCARGGDGSR